jgi:peptidoglycan/LPS O-acetylase OafA/YrhL
MLRGMAVLLVMFHHHTAFPFLQSMGWIGVDLFFVLSGFLVSGLVFDEYRRTGTFAAGRFLIRRGFKIYPSFHLLIVVTALLMYATHRQDPWMNYVAEVLFFQNYHEGLWGHTWTLAVEEHFYLLLVLFALTAISFRLRLRWPMFVALCSFTFLACWTMRWNAQLHVSDGFGPLFPTHLRMDALAAGVLLSGWFRYRPTSFHAVFSGSRQGMFVLLLLLLVLVKLSLRDYGYGYTFGLTGAYLASLVAVGLSVSYGARGSAPGRWQWLMAPLAWVGRSSYNIYLWHLLVLLGVQLVFTRIGGGGGYMEFLAFGLASVGLGAIATRVVEDPFLRLRERNFPTRRA